MTNKEIGGETEAKAPTTPREAHVDVATTLPAAMPGRASPAKAAVGG